MLHTNEWTPDTCQGGGCIVEFVWYDEDDPLIATPTRIIKSCPDHASLTEPQEFFDTLLDENQRKNKLVNELAENETDYPEMGIVKGDHREFNDLSKFIYTFSGEGKNRVINLNLSGSPLTAQQKAKLQTFANSRFGAGKVVIS